jgi:hypothetical protein
VLIIIRPIVNIFYTSYWLKYLYVINSNVHCETDTVFVFGNHAAALPVRDSGNAEVSVLYHTVISNIGNNVLHIIIMYQT